MFSFKIEQTIFVLCKVEAARLAIEAIDLTIDIDAIVDRFRPRQRTGQAVFACVDSIAARTAIWRALGGKVGFWADGRRLGEVIRVLAVSDTKSAEHYRALQSRHRRMIQTTN